MELMRKSLAWETERRRSGWLQGWFLNDVEAERAVPAPSRAGGGVPVTNFGRYAVVAEEAADSGGRRPEAALRARVRGALSVRSRRARRSRRSRGAEEENPFAASTNRSPPACRKREAEWRAFTRRGSMRTTRTPTTSLPSRRRRRRWPLQVRRLRSRRRRGGVDEQKKRAQMVLLERRSATSRWTSTCASRSRGRARTRRGTGGARLRARRDHGPAERRGRGGRRAAALAEPLPDPSRTIPDGDARGNHRRQLAAFDEARKAKAAADAAKGGKAGGVRAAVGRAEKDAEEAKTAGRWTPRARWTPGAITASHRAGTCEIR